MPRLLGEIAPPILCGVFLLLGITSLARKNATFDEVTHIPAGYSYLRTADMGLNPEHPPLAKVLAALPLLALDLEDPRSFPEYTDADRWQWSFGPAFLYRNRTPAERIVFWARIPMILLAASMGILIYRWSREIHGEVGGLISLCLFALSPNLLAHGRLVTTDVPVSLFSLATVYFLWRSLSSPPGRAWFLYAVSLALALLSKYTAVLLPPAALAATLAWALIERPSRPVARTVLVRFAIATSVPLLLVAAFGFGPAPPFAYLAGFRESLAKLNPAHPFYMAGVFSREGFYAYYILAFLLKTPLPTLLLLLLASLAVRRHPRLALVAIAAPVLLFLLAPSIRRYNIGLRYILPVYPLLFVFAGGASHHLLRSRILAAIGALLLVCLAVGTLLAHPHYIPYFNEIAGGPGDALRWLDDSNVDWGQDLKALGGIARREGWEGIAILYHGMARTDYYLPGSYRPSPAEVAAPRPGQIYAMSAQYVLRTGWLDTREPFRTVGYSIYLYRFP